MRAMEVDDEAACRAAAFFDSLTAYASGIDLGRWGRRVSGLLHSDKAAGSRISRHTARDGRPFEVVRGSRRQNAYPILVTALRRPLRASCLR